MHKLRIFLKTNPFLKGGKRQKKLFKGKNEIEGAPNVFARSMSGLNVNMKKRELTFRIL
jgi:hypothetical protein